MSLTRMIGCVYRQQFLQTFHCTNLLQRVCATSWKRRFIREQEQKKIVVDASNVKRTDRVYVWGSTQTGALGLKNLLRPKNKLPRTHQFGPHRLPFMDSHFLKARHVACGYGTTVYLCDSNHDGMVAFGCGVNTSSQLGYQESPPRSGRILDYVIEPALIDLPLQHPRKTKLVNVACGRAHTWIVSDTEGIFTLGDNSSGQCGRNIVPDETHRGSQTINRISFPHIIDKLECGQDVTVVLTGDGQVFTCGISTSGQTGVASCDPVESLTRVQGDIAGERIVDISVKLDSVLAVSASGDLFGWGNSEYGQFSSIVDDEICLMTSRHLPFNNIGRVVKVAAAGTMCAVLNETGDVYVWGRGILGQGPRVSRSDQPLHLPRPLFGCNQLNPSQKVVDIEAGISHFAALTETGELYMWGKNDTSCLGLGDKKHQYFPFKVEVPANVSHVACGVDHTVALSKSFA